ncbi:MAG: DMT family transporter [Spirochaetota bacterium]
MRSQTPIRSIIELNIAVVLFGGTALFAKIVPLPVPFIILGRSAVAAAALLVFLVATGTSFRPASRRDFALLAGLGVLLAVHWVTYFQAIRVSTVAVGTISLHTYPIITVLLEPLVERKRLHLADAVLAVVVLAGIIVLVPEFTLASTTSQGVLWGVAAALLFTIRNLVVRRLVQRYSGSTMMFYQTAVSALVLLPFVALSDGLGPVVAQWPRFLLLGTVFTALTQTLYASSLRLLSAKTVSIIATLLPFHSTVFALIILGEVPTVRTVVGGVIVVAAVMIETARAAGGPPAARQRDEDEQAAGTSDTR